MKRRRRRRSKKTLIISSICATFVILLIFAMLYMLIYSIKYSSKNRNAKQKKYEQAYEKCIILGKSEETKEELEQAAVDYAEHLMVDNDYEKAVEVLETTEEKESLQQCYQEYADYLAKQKEYSLAITWYERVENKDVTKELLAAKYAYVKSEENYNRLNYTTCRYLKDLMAAEYKDSAKLYEELYAWKATIIANEDKSDQKTHIESFQMGKLVHFHVKLIGGEPQERATMRYEITDASGEVISGEWNKVKCDEKGCWQHIEYYVIKETDMLTLKIYDQNNKVLGEQGVKINE